VSALLSADKLELAYSQIAVCREISLHVNRGEIVVQDIFRTIRSINSAGTSVLLVEQNARYALETASRGYVLQTGAIIASGTCDDLKQNPRVQEAYLGRSMAVPAL
jgi:ABC-type branched-subunit amino acid transport system ATPase component